MVSGRVTQSEFHFSRIALVGGLKQTEGWGREHQGAAVVMVLLGNPGVRRADKWLDSETFWNVKQYRHSENSLAVSKTKQK